MPELQYDDLHTRPTVPVRSPTLAKLVARTRCQHESDPETLEGTPADDLLAEAGGEALDAVRMMRELYASGDVAGALAIASLIAPAEYDSVDPVGHGKPSGDPNEEIALDEWDFEAIDLM